MNEKGFIGIYFTALSPRLPGASLLILISCWMDTFAHFRRSEKLDKFGKIAIACERNDRRREKSREQRVGKLKMFFLAETRSLARAVEWIFPQALFSVWVLVFVIQVAFDGGRANVHPVQKKKQSKAKWRQSKCVLLSVGLLYDIN